jgi:prepilin-type N-terminal cleavage/methylation domain-containing protein
MKPPATRIRRAFTLIELLVVIAVISLLVAVLVPVMISFLKGRGLTMVGNNIAGFIAFARGEAMNTRLSHVIVMYPESEEITGPDAVVPLYVGPGMACFRINPNPEPGEQVITFARQLDFAADIGGSEIVFAERWRRHAPVGPVHELPPVVNERFGDKYMLVMRPDGRVVIPGDKPGYRLDTDDLRGLDTDLILKSGGRYVFIDLNSATGAVKRSPVLTPEDFE